MSLARIEGSSETAAAGCPHLAAANFMHHQMPSRVAFYRDTAI